MSRRRQKAAPDGASVAAALSELGTTGLVSQGGVISEDALRVLEGPRGLRVFREMRDIDPVVGAFLFAIEMLIRGVDWTVDEDDADPDSAEFLDSCRNDMSTSWIDTIIEVLSFLPFGWSYHEVVYKYRRGDTGESGTQSNYNDGKIGWRKMPIRAQDTLLRWELDPAGGVKGMWQSAAPAYVPVFLPIEKSLLFRTTQHKGNPQGKSVLYNAYRPWYLKKHIEDIEAIGVERDLTGLPVMKVPITYLDPKSSDPGVVMTRTVLQNMLRNVKRDEQEGLMLPLVYDEQGHELFKFELLTTGGRRVFDTVAINDRYDRRILMSVMAQFLMLGGAGSTGSWALSVDQSDLFAIAISAWLDSIAEVFNRHAVPKLFRMNGMDTEVMPKLAHGKVRSVDIEKLGNFILKMSQAGATLFADPEYERKLLEEVGLPLPAPGSAALIPGVIPQPAGAATPPAAPTERPPAEQVQGAPPAKLNGGGTPPA